MAILVPWFVSFLTRTAGTRWPAGGFRARVRFALLLTTVLAAVNVTGVSGQRNGSEGDEIASVALQYKGVRYAWGGVTPSGFDCSGLLYYVLGQVGDPVPRDHYGQINSGVRVNRSDLQPGDMVFFRNTYEPGLSHSGIYVGGDQFIHAGTPSSGVIVSSLSDPYWSSHWAGATRVWATTA